MRRGQGSAPPPVTSTPDNPQLSNRAIGVEPKRHIRRIPERIGPGHSEDIVLPVLQLAARRARLQRQASVREPYGGSPVKTVGIRARIPIERQRRMRARDALALLGRL